MSVLLSLDELKRLMRRIEFNRTDYELLCDLIKKAEEHGTLERRRLSRLSKLSSRLLDEFLKERLVRSLSLDGLKKAASSTTWGVDGSCQLLKGFDDCWFAFLSAARVYMPEGIYGDIIAKVGGWIEPIRTPEDREASKKATLIMMRMEMEQMRNVSREADTIAAEKAYLVIDGPIVDPPWLTDENYIAERVKVINECLSKGIIVIGFVKRPFGRLFLSYARENIDEHGIIDNYTSDISLLSPLMYMAMREKRTKLVMTSPLEMSAANEVSPAYRRYEDEGLRVHYCYYKFGFRRRVYRLEIAGLDDLTEKEILRTFADAVRTLAGLTPPGVEYPLPVLLAHNKCNIRRGAAETLYYEIITRALAQDTTLAWLSL